MQIYKRILLKLSGESLSNDEKNLSIDYDKISLLVHQIKELQKFNIEIGIVVGGGNFWRGASATKNGIPRNRADYIGMLATIMNALAVESILNKHNIKSMVASALDVDAKVAQKYVNEIALKNLKEKKVVIFAGGTGRPYFTTDTTATLVASEIQADVVLLAKNNIDGVFDKDPNKFDDAKHFDAISYNEILKKDLLFMDSTATSMAKTNKLKLIIFDINKDNSIIRVLKDEIKHTKVGF